MWEPFYWLTLYSPIQYYFGRLTVLFYANTFYTQSINSTIFKGKSSLVNYILNWVNLNTAFEIGLQCSITIFSLIFCVAKTITILKYFRRKYQLLEKTFAEGESKGRPKNMCVFAPRSWSSHNIRSFLILLGRGELGGKVLRTRDARELANLCRGFVQPYSSNG